MSGSIFQKKLPRKAKDGSERIPEHGQKWNLKPPRSDFLANGGRFSARSTKVSRIAKYRKIRTARWKSVEDIQTDSERKRQESCPIASKKTVQQFRKTEGGRAEKFYCVIF